VSRKKPLMITDSNQVCFVTMSGRKVQEGSAEGVSSNFWPAGFSQHNQGPVSNFFRDDKSILT
jgi:hypothetical protein